MSEPKIDHISPTPLDVSGKTLAMITGGGVVVGALIVLGAILPAEYNADPIGLGKLTGISRLWAPEANDWSAGGDVSLSYTSAQPKGQLTVEIPLGASGWSEEAVEYKVYMRPGQGILYKWQARRLDGEPLNEPVEYDMHGHDVVDETGTETVVEYRKAEALSDQGSLTAPLEGIHGWYFKNHSPEPIIIRLEVEGYFDRIEPGDPGNEFRVRPEN